MTTAQLSHSRRFLSQSQPTRRSCTVFHLSPFVKSSCLHNEQANECVRDERTPPQPPDRRGGRISAGTLSKAKNPASWSVCTDALDSQLPSFSTYTVETKKRGYAIYILLNWCLRNMSFSQVCNKLMMCVKLMVAPFWFFHFP